VPTYSYQCEHCGRFEYKQPISEPALEACPHCSNPVKRLIGRNVSILFKGSGFYATDSRRGTGSGIMAEAQNEESAPAAEAVTAKAAEPAGETKSEAVKPSPGVAATS